MEEIEALMKGGTEKLSFSEECSSHPMADIYYLIADHHFKNKEWDLAIYYYTRDLTVSPTRLDSWAGLSLAQKTRLETLLNSCENITDEEVFLKNVSSACVCFNKALEQDYDHSNLWVEMGGLVYMTFSHASRLLKQDLNPDISIEMYQLLEDTKATMLAKSEQCFLRALELSETEEEYDEESWLYHYMLGKIGEKKSESPHNVINYYLSASKHLHLNAASYPSKIGYNNPQEFAVESLEMYFRVHGYIIKYIEQRDTKLLTDDVLKYFLSVTEQILKDPFATMTEFKVQVVQNSIVSGDNEKRSNESCKIVQSILSEIVESALEKVTTNKQHDSSIEEIIPSDTKSIHEKKKDVSSDDEIMVVEETQADKDKKIIISRCLEAFNLCLKRFPHHYKSLYRLAQYYHTTKNSRDRDNNRTRNYLIGCSMWQTVDYMHVNGLFNERKIWYQQPKNCNLFHGVWRIPNDEIDRPGSFAAHMYRCVSLSLDVLPSVKDFLTTLDIALALKMSPEKDKKYLRENERQLLCEHATQVGLQAIKDKFRILFKTNAVVGRNRRMTFLFDVYRCYRHLSKHLTATENVLGTILAQTYAALEGVTSSDTAALIRKAEGYCSTHNMAGHSYNSRGGLSSNQQFNARGGRLKRLATAMAATPSTVTQQPVTTTAAAASGLQQLPQSAPMSQKSANVQLSTQSTQHHQPPSADAQTNNPCPPNARSSSSTIPQARTTPLPRSAPVPRLSATPVPRSTASPLPRKEDMNAQNVDTAIKTTCHDDTIQKAYQIYERLIHCQTQFKNKLLDQKAILNYKTQSDTYQKQLLQYLKIPAVSHYFTKSLQQMGNTASKLPKPSGSPTGTTTSVSNTNRCDATVSVVNSKTTNTKPVIKNQQFNNSSVTITPSKKSSTDITKAKVSTSASKSSTSSSFCSSPQVINITSSSKNKDATLASNSLSSTIKPSVTLTPKSINSSSQFYGHGGSKNTVSRKSNIQSKGIILPHKASDVTVHSKLKYSPPGSINVAKSLPKSLSVTVTPSKNSPGIRNQSVRPPTAPSVAITSKSNSLVQLNTEELMKLAYSPVIPSPPVTKLVAQRKLNLAPTPSSGASGKKSSGFRLDYKHNNMEKTSQVSRVPHAITSQATNTKQQGHGGAEIPPVRPSSNAIKQQRFKSSHLSSQHTRPAPSSAACVDTITKGDPLCNADDDIITLD